MTYLSFINLTAIRQDFQGYKVSPNLMLYKSQFTSFFSIFLRISGSILGFYLIFMVLNYNFIFFTSNLNYLIFELFFNFDFFEIIYLTYGFFIFFLYFFIYHLFFGIRVWIITNKYNIQLFQRLLELKIYYKLGFILVYFLVFILIKILILIFFFF